MRRLFALRKRRRLRGVWPIKPGTETPPPDWGGWPDGKKFAVIFTHDVERQKGLDRCRDLMHLEQEMGFRSSFNFIPEGSYRVSKELREELVRNGFEVGVHDLHHDGKLYYSRATFAAGARRINDYVKEWKAQGFRSGMMHHNLDWIQDLDVLYDASTFDTDPFEPQSDGMDTIFPFRIPGRNGRPGYVEMPYTLPQDSTLFLVFQEKNAEIWKRKVDWVAAHGGMVLLNTHPDYMCFNGGAPRMDEFPVDHYRELLDYIRTQYAGQYYHAVPRDLAKIVVNSPAASVPAARRRICMITYSFYKRDNRVMRYCKTLVEQGYHVDVLALSYSSDLLPVDNIDGVTVHRLQARDRKAQKSRSSYLLPLLSFCFKSSAWLSLKHLENPYDLIHVHNIPDFLVFAAWLPRLGGVPIILDIHDLVPEFYSNKFGKKYADRVSIQMLKKAEELSTRFSSHVIISNHLWRETLARSVSSEKCSVFINNVDRTVFYPRPKNRTDKNPLVIFPGGLQWHQGLDIAIRAFALVKTEMPEATFHIYGDGQAKDDLLALIDELALQQTVKIFEPLSAMEIAEVMANADLGVVPKRADSFGNEAYSTKIMEFMSLGIPVVVSRTKIDSYYFNDDVVRFFESGSVHELSCAIVELLNNPQERERLANNGLAYAEKHSWGKKKQDYCELVASLTG